MGDVIQFRHPVVKERTRYKGARQRGIWGGKVIRVGVSRIPRDRRARMIADLKKLRMQRVQDWDSAPREIGRDAFRAYFEPLKGDAWVDAYALYLQRHMGAINPVTAMMIAREIPQAEPSKRAPGKMSDEELIEALSEVLEANSNLLAEYSRRRLSVDFGYGLSF